MAKRRGPRPHRHRQPPAYEFVTGVCRSGKRGYWTSSAAKAAAKALKRQSRDPGVHAYNCPFCDYFHIGHLADGVRRGRLTKAEAYPQRARPA